MAAEPAVRTVEVDPERVGRWVAGFAERHGAVRVDASTAYPGQGLRLVAADGATADFSAWPEEVADAAAGHPAARGREAPADLVARLVRPPDRMVLALVRRGGYAVGLAEGAALVRHRCGTRYVQSRTAAGGWSQQRYARRRANQADALVEAVGGHLGRVLREHSAQPGSWTPRGLVLGGDKALVGRLRQVLSADPVTRALPELPARVLYDIPDPRLEVLRAALRRGRAARVRLREPEPGRGSG